MPPMLLRLMAAFVIFSHPAIAQPLQGPQPCSNPTCGSPPCAAPLTGDVGCTTVSGTVQYNHESSRQGNIIASNTHIYGPFEAGFGAQQNSIIQGWGCSNPSVVYDSEGGLDLNTAEEKVAAACGLGTFPSISGNMYIGIVGYCGGHTQDYHFHVRFGCLYAASGAHSTKVGIVAQYSLYGKWEDHANQKLPLLDACGAHFGATPDSSSSVYHYHVQDNPPFSVGCYGPAANNQLMSVSGCRALYTSGTRRCDTSGYASITVKRNGQIQTITYDKWCPCWDAAGSNLATNIQELPALSCPLTISYTSGTSPSCQATTTTTTATTTTVVTTTATTETTTTATTRIAATTTTTETTTTSTTTTATTITTPPSPPSPSQPAPSPPAPLPPPFSVPTPSLSAPPAPPTPAPQSVIVRGSLSFKIADAAALANDRNADIVLVETIAVTSGVQQNQVNIDSVSAVRRLRPGRAWLSSTPHAGVRRLQQPVRVEFRLTASSRAVADSAVSSLAGVAPAAMRAELNLAMARHRKNYVVLEVTSVTAAVDGGAVSASSDGGGDGTSVGVILLIVLGGICACGCAGVVLLLLFRKHSTARVHDVSKESSVVAVASGSEHTNQPPKPPAKAPVIDVTRKQDQLAIVSRPEVPSRSPSNMSASTRASSATQSVCTSQNSTATPVSGSGGGGTPVASISRDSHSPVAALTGQRAVVPSQRMSHAGSNQAQQAQQRSHSYGGQRQSQLQRPTQGKVCSCGAALTASQRFCGVCGKKVSDAQVSSEQHGSRHSHAVGATPAHANRNRRAR